MTPGPSRPYQPFFDEAAPAARFLVAEADGRILGYIRLTTHPAWPPTHVLAVRGSPSPTRRAGAASARASPGRRRRARRRARAASPCACSRATPGAPSTRPRGSPSSVLPGSSSSTAGTSTTSAWTATCRPRPHRIRCGAAHESISSPVSTGAVAVAARRASPATSAPSARTHLGVRGGPGEPPRTPGPPWSAAGPGVAPAGSRGAGRVDLPGDRAVLPESFWARSPAPGSRPSPPEVQRPVVRIARHHRRVPARRRWARTAAPGAPQHGYSTATSRSGSISTTRAGYDRPTPPIRTLRVVDAGHHVRVGHHPLRHVHEPAALAALGARSTLDLHRAPAWRRRPRPGDAVAGRPGHLGRRLVLERVEHLREARLGQRGGGPRGPRGRGLRHRLPAPRRAAPSSVSPSSGLRRGRAQHTRRHPGHDQHRDAVGHRAAHAVRHPQRTPVQPPRSRSASRPASSCPTTAGPSTVTTASTVAAAVPRSAWPGHPRQQPRRRPRRPRTRPARHTRPPVRAGIRTPRRRRSPARAAGRAGPRSRLFSRTPRYGRDRSADQHPHGRGGHRGRNRSHTCVPSGTTRTGTMVPPGGTAHIAGTAGRPESGIMRVVRRAVRGAARRAVRGAARSVAPGRPPRCRRPGNGAPRRRAAPCSPCSAACPGCSPSARSSYARAASSAPPRPASTGPATPPPGAGPPPPTGPPGRASCPRSAWLDRATGRTQPAAALRRQGGRRLRPPHRLAQRLPVRRRAPRHPPPVRRADRRPPLGRHRLQLRRRPLRHHLRGPRRRRSTGPSPAPTRRAQPPHRRHRRPRHLHRRCPRAPGHDRRDRRPGRLEARPGRRRPARPGPAGLQQRPQPLQGGHRRHPCPPSPATRTASRPTAPARPSPPASRRSGNAPRPCRGRTPATRSPVTRTPATTTPAGRTPTGRAPTGRAPTGRTPTGAATRTATPTAPARPDDRPDHRPQRGHRRPAAPPPSPASLRSGHDSGRPQAGTGEHHGQQSARRPYRVRAGSAPGRTRTARGPWAVVCAAVTVVLGPAAVTASALDQANAAPMHHPVKADRTGASPAADSTRRRTATA